MNLQHYFDPYFITPQGCGSEWLIGRWVAKKEDGWLSGRWVAKREMGGYFDSAPACYGIYLGSNPDISQKYKMGDISKGIANTL
jgi:hypothetical protein